MKRTWIVLLVFVSWVDAQALAQSDSVIVSQSKIEVTRATDVEARIAALDRAHDEVSLRGPKAGLAVSSALLVGGVFTMAVGLAYRSFCLSDFFDPTCDNRGARAAAGTGGAVIAASLTGLIISAIRLKKNKEQRRTLRRQRIALELGLGTGIK